MQPRFLRLLGARSLILLLFFFLTLAPVGASQDGGTLSKSISHYTKGMMNDLLGLTEEAIEEYKKAAEYDNSSYVIHLRLGADYARLGQFPEAIEQLKLVSQFKPEDLQSRYLLALIYSTQKNFDQAAREYETILQFLSQNDPQNIEIHNYLGQLYYSQRKYDQAIKQFEMIRDVEKENPEVLYVLSSLYVEVNDRSQAVQLLKLALHIDPNHDGCLNSLAYIYAEEGKNLDEALDLVNRALELDPDNGAYLDTLGWVYYQKEMYPEALEYLMKADEALKDPVIYDHLGDVYYKLGKIDQAKDSWNRSLELLPAQQEIVDKLNRLSGGKEAKNHQGVKK